MYNHAMVGGVTAIPFRDGRYSDTESEAQGHEGDGCLAREPNTAAEGLGLDDEGERPYVNLVYVLWRCPQANRRVEHNCRKSWGFVSSCGALEAGAQGRPRTGPQGTGY